MKEGRRGESASDQGAGKKWRSHSSRQIDERLTKEGSRGDGRRDVHAPGVAMEGVPAAQAEGPGRKCCGAQKGQAMRPIMSFPIKLEVRKQEAL